MQEQATSLQKEAQKRQREIKNNERQVKSQLESLQNLIKGKDETLTSLQSRNAEQTSELAQHTEIRDKLNEHIIYLQNEVRKRDELLEGGSEFGGDDDFAPESDSGSMAEEVLSTKNVNDSSSVAKSGALKTQRTTKRRTMGQILKSQLEETRLSLKNQIESKLRAEKQVQNIEQKLSKLTEGLKEIYTIVN